MPGARDAGAVGAGDLADLVALGVTTTMSIDWALQEGKRVRDGARRRPAAVQQSN